MESTKLEISETAIVQNNDFFKITVHITQIGISPALVWCMEMTSE